MGMANLDAELIDRLNAEPIYRDLFPKAFPDRQGEISLATVVRCAVRLPADDHFRELAL